ncbi:hypothetical protein B566_EDAN008982 [Ephemera danica]|nr:hypothetical protein B566_EDAN008982 [Ephemera danica]
MKIVLLAFLFIIGTVYTQGKMNYWWTNGNNIAGTDSWQWGTQGAAFDNKDSRWGPQEPDGDQVQWQLEHVAVRVLDAMFYSQLDVNTNHAMCEE